MAEALGMNPVLGKPELRMLPVQFSQRSKDIDQRKPVLFREVPQNIVQPTQSFTVAADRIPNRNKPRPVLVEWKSRQQNHFDFLRNQPFDDLPDPFPE